MSKVIAIIDRPANCESCVFGVCKYSLPLSTNRKGYYCRLKGEAAVEDFDYDAEVHLSNCPLRELPKKQKHHCTDTANHRFAKQGYNACLHEILKGGE